MNKGKYIVLEGPEGTGKSTQIMELASRLQAAGLPVRVLREPDSQSDLTARALRTITQDPHYPLNTKTEVLLYNAARSQSLDVIRKSVEQGVICLVDRNYLTTLAVQYYGRGDVPDYQAINNIIDFAVGDNQPDLTIILDAPAQVLKERTANRYQGERFDNLDAAFLERVRAGYLWEAKQRGLPVVTATGTIQEVSDQIWPHVANVLQVREDTTEAPATPIKEVIEAKLASSAPAASQTAQAPSAEKTAETDTEAELVVKNEDGSYTITDAGQEYLQQAVTSTDDNVYAFSDKLSPITIAAAMARLSRRGDDMRITILDEFAGKIGKDEQLLKRIITAFGDDSVQQLGGIHVVVENASNLLTKKLEWGRLAAYLEQSTRYIYFDTKDKDGRYKFHIPEHFDNKTKQEYTDALNKVFDLYSDMVHKLTDYVRSNSSVPEAERDVAWNGATRAQACDAIRPVLPVATQSTVGIFASGQAYESLIMHLLADELQEAKITGQKLLDQGRQVIPMFLERADKPERGGAMVAYAANTRAKVGELAKQLLPSSYGADYLNPVTLVDYWPKNELLAVADILYDHTNLPLEQIQSEVSTWSYNKKVEVFKAYMGERLNRRHKPGRALEKTHYSLDLLCDYGIFRDLQRHRMVDDLTWQELTPRYGYEIPKLVEEAGLTDQFEQCFDISLQLYGLLQERGYALDAQYATLMGHRMRWKMTMNAREAFHFIELRTSPQGHPGYRKLAKEIYDKIAEVHPLTAESMQFVNQDENAELTRLAAERYTQYKLKQLDNKQA